ncbi:MAG TPA: hypothetical protein VM715_15440, partial [Candidatus Acidoferrum sp.]|nr:hypothetical protein [Candidatus Acidoferrum sp.]
LKVGRYSCGDDGSGSGDRQSGSRQNEWQGDRNEPTAHAVRQDQKKENERSGGFALTHHYRRGVVGNLRGIKMYDSPVLKGTAGST